MNSILKKVLFGITLTTLFVSCNSNKEKNKISEKKKIVKEIPLKIGDKYEGGYIVSLDFDGKHGKICAPYGEGDDKLLSQDEAIRYAEKIKINGFDNWRLPTKEEFRFIYKLNINQILQFKEAKYWTSEKFEDDEYLYQNFVNMKNGQIENTMLVEGSVEKSILKLQDLGIDYDQNFYKHNVRLIRDF